MNCLNCGFPMNEQPTGSPERHTHRYVSDCLSNLRGEIVRLRRESVAEHDLLLQWMQANAAASTLLAEQERELQQLKRERAELDAQMAKWVRLNNARTKFLFGD